ncbi:MAG: hypothetical protein ABR503_06145 [Chitinophagaceae bacterium]
MRIKILIAFVLLAIGLIYVVDWVVFSIQDVNEKLSWEEFKLKYVKRFPDSLQSLIQIRGLPGVCFTFVFGIAGAIFINDFVNNNNKKAYFIIGIFSFVMAGWQIFSLM